MARVVLLAGSGGDLGPALAAQLVKAGWRVIGAGRDPDRLAEALRDLPVQREIVELSDEAQVQALAKRVGPVDAVVHLAGRIDLGPLAETTPSIFEASWRANCYGPYLVARAFTPAMIHRGRGTLVFMGATSSWRGSARTAAFSSGKQALRGLAQSLAKELGPRGIHVAHLVIDGKIAGARTVARFPEVRSEDCLEPGAVASAIMTLLEQGRSAWTFELDLRPDRERW